MGAQSLDDRILDMNKRGHDVECTRQATALLRAAGFKIVLHWMPNLLGATPESDREDFAKFWGDFCPDEIKIYPNPSDGRFFIDIGSQETSFEILIVDLIGQVRFQQVINSSTFLVDGTFYLPAGIYYVWVKNEKGSLVRSVIVAR